MTAPGAQAALGFWQLSHFLRKATYMKARLTATWPGQPSTME